LLAKTIDSALNYIRSKQQSQQNKRQDLDSTSDDDNIDVNDEQLTKAGGRQTVIRMYEHQNYLVLF
jgi:hypothetical protein